MNIHKKETENRPLSPFYDGMTDEELIARFRNGDTGVSDYLIGKYKGLVRRKVRAMYLIGGDTDDLIQEGMIGLFKAIRDYSPDREASFMTFANICVERQLITAVQNSNRQKNIPLNQALRLESEEAAGLAGPFREADPESIMIDLENLESLERSIRKELSPMENEVLGYYLAGDSYTMIGQRMGKPAKSIDNALQRIRRKVSAFVR